jgi:hypothetical protein
MIELRAGFLRGAGIVALLLGGASIQAQQIVRPPVARVNPNAPKVVRTDRSNISVNIRPATPVVTYGYTNAAYFRPPAGSGYVPAYGSAVVSPYVAPYAYGAGRYDPNFNAAASPGPYGTFGIPSYNYQYYGGAQGGYGTMTPGLTIGVGNAGYGPWTYVGPVY